jgi:hypothetical protein
MKKFRLSLIYIGIAVLVGAYIYFFERGPAKTDEQSKTKVFDSFVADDIRKIRVEHFGATLTAMKDPIDIEKDGQGVWQVTAPKKYRADENTIRTMLSTIGDFNPENVIENPADLVEYGLNSPTARCALVNQAGVSFVLVVGNKNVTDSSFYTKTADKKAVYLLTSYGVGLMTKGLNDYRDHTFLKTDLVLAQKIEMSYGEKSVVFEKGKDNDWSILKPIKTKADATRLRDLLTNINTLRIEEFVTDQPSGLEPYGLDRPRGVFKVWPSEGDAVRGFLIGAKKPDTSFRYAKALDAPAVSLVRDYFDNTLDFKLREFRNKTLLRFDAAQAKTLTIRHADKKIVYQKALDGQWAAEGRPQANPEAVGLISDLSNALIQDFPEKTAETGLRDSAYSAEVILSDGTVRAYRFGSQEKEQVYVSMDTDPEAYLAPASMFTQIRAILTAPTPTVPPAAVTPAAK